MKRVGTLRALSILSLRQGANDVKAMEDCWEMCFVHSPDVPDGGNRKEFQEVVHAV